MKKVLLLVIQLALVVFVSGVMAIQKPAPDPASAGPAPTEPVKQMIEKKIEKIEKFSGVIEKVDEKGKTIVVKGKMIKEEKTLTFAIDDKTKITKDKATIALRDLKKNMQVSIEYKKEMDKMIAVAIEASAPQGALKKM
jgi:hypothetical protein